MTRIRSRGVARGSNKLSSFITTPGRGGAYRGGGGRFKLGVSGAIPPGDGVYQVNQRFFQIAVANGCKMSGS